MSYSHHVNRDPITATIRSRYPEIHSPRCRCSLGPSLVPEIEALRTQNIQLRGRIQQGVEPGEKIIIEDRLRFMQTENRKLHGKIVQYQSTMQQLQKTHMELIRMVKQQQKSNISLANTGNSGLISQNRLSDHRNDVINQSLQGQYYVSLRKLKSNREGSLNQSIQQREGFQSTHKKNEIKLNFDHSIKKGEHSLTPQRTNPQYYSNNPKQFSDRELKQAYEKIKKLEFELSQNSKQKANSRSIEKQNQQLKQRIKSIEGSIRSYQQSVQHYQNEITKLQKVVGELKAKQNSGSVTVRQNISLKDSNGYLRKQIEDIEAELERERQINSNLRGDIESENQKNLSLVQESTQSNTFTNQLDNQERKILLLNQEIESKSRELLNVQAKAKRYQNLVKELMEIKEIIESVNLMQIDSSERITVIEYKKKLAQQTHEISVLTSQSQRYRQEILILQQKVTVITTEKQIVSLSLRQNRKEQDVLLDQIKSLENSIEKYLQQEHLSSKKIIIEELHQGEAYPAARLREVKFKIEEIVSRLGHVQEKLQEQQYN